MPDPRDDLDYFPLADDIDDIDVDVFYAPDRDDQLADDADDADYPGFQEIPYDEDGEPTEMEEWRDYDENC